MGRNPACHFIYLLRSFFEYFLNICLKCFDMCCEFCSNTVLLRMPAVAEESFKNVVLVINSFKISMKYIRKETSLKIVCVGQEDIKLF